MTFMTAIDTTDLRGEKKKSLSSILEYIVTVRHLSESCILYDNVICTITPID